MLRRKSCRRGCSPKYKKPFTLSLYKCASDSCKGDEWEDIEGCGCCKLIAQSCFTLGKGKCSFKFPTKEDKKQCNDDQGGDNLNVNLDKDDSGNFIFVLTAENRYTISPVELRRRIARDVWKPVNILAAKGGTLAGDGQGRFMPSTWWSLSHSVIRDLSNRRMTSKSF